MSLFFAQVSDLASIRQIANLNDSGGQATLLPENSRRNMGGVWAALETSFRSQTPRASSSATSFDFKLEDEPTICLGHEIRGIPSGEDEMKYRNAPARNSQRDKRLS